MDKKDKVILSVDYPQITSWQWHAALFSILGKENYAQDWIYSNYIQIRSYFDKDANSKSDILFVDCMPSDNSLKDCPYLLAQPITQQQILTYSGDFLQFLLKSLDMSYYIFGICDETDMLNREWRILHQIFIYGYDLEKQVFHVGDFTFTGKFSYTTVPFNTLVEGFLNVKPGEDFVFDAEHKDMYGLYLLSKNLGKKYYSFDAKYVKRNINEYLNCTNTEEHYRHNRNYEDKFIFGVDVYTAIVKQITLLEEGIVQRYDYRPFHVIYDHKVLMKDRLQYMMDNNYIPNDHAILDDYEEVKKTVLFTRNSFLRASNKRDLSLLSKVKTHLMNAKEKEIEVLTRVEGLL